MQVLSLSEIVRMGAQMILQSVLEEEVTAYIMRDYYERFGDKKSKRNGSKPLTVKTGCGVLPLKMPQVRGAGGPFHSVILPPIVTRMDEVGELIPLLYMNGISTRKVKKAVGKFLGQNGLSHQNVSRISGKIVGRVQAMEDKRPLKSQSGISDTGWGKTGRSGQHNGERGGIGSMGILRRRKSRAYKRVNRNQESYNSWKEFLNDLARRGVNESMLTIIDGCPELVKAVHTIFSENRYSKIYQA